MEKDYQCSFCKRVFSSKQALGSHTGKCKQNPNASNKELTEKQKARNLSRRGQFFQKKEQCFCEFCNREFDYKYAKSIHLKTCKQNPNRDEDYSKYLSDKNKKAVTKELREEASKRTVFNNFWKYRAKNPIIYESPIAGKIKLDSKWEELVAKRLDELQVEWYRPKCRLPYYDLDGIEHSYLPDFYVKTYNCFIEVKSPFISKWQNSQNKVSYVKEHYKFVKWLESEDACRLFELQDLKCSFIPEKDEDNISYWIEKSEALKKERKEKRRVLKEIQKKKSEAFRNEQKEKWGILKEAQKKKSEALRKERKEKQRILKEIQKKEFEALEKEQYRLLIEKSNIDFSKFGWVGKLSKLINKPSKYIRKHIPLMFPEIEFFTRAGENSNANKHWWTNGIEEVSAVICPEGWWNGRITSK